MNTTDKKEVKTMLLQFKIKNYRSFIEETILDLTATGIKENELSLLEKNKIKVLPIIAIYGANASGKSNLFSAFQAMRNTVLSYNEINDIALDIVPYWFNLEQLSAPSDFEVSINIENKEYRYGFSKTQDKVYEEWLYEKGFYKNTKSKEKCVFYRNYNNFSSFELSPKEEKEFKYVSSMITENELLISAIGKRNSSKYSCIYNWFYLHSTVLSYSNDSNEKARMNVVFSFLYSNKKMKKEVVDLIHLMDPAIINIKVDKDETFTSAEKYKITAVHYDDIGNESLVPMSAESGGTQKILSLAIDVLFTLLSESVLFVDELDAKLHPLMLRYILNMFNDKKINAGGAQLVFSAHNIVCLDSTDLRRDEIWFVEKRNQKSSLYSLYDFKSESEKIRSDLCFGKHYLTGRFGAVPFQEED